MSRTLKLFSHLIAYVAVFVASVTLFAAGWPAETAMENLQRAEFSRTLDNTAFEGWKLYESSQMDRPLTAFGAPVFIGQTDAETNAVSMIREATGCVSDFEVLKIFRQKNVTRIHYRELRGGLPVLTGRAEAVINRSDEIMRWSLREYSNWSVVGVHTLSLEQAAMSLGDWSINHEKSFAAWYPVFDNRELIPVYWIRIEGNEPHERHEGIVDAGNGNVILEWPGIHTDVISGTVSGHYWQPYEHSDPEVGVHANAGINVNAVDDFTNLAGEFAVEAGSHAAMDARLEGLHVDVSNEDGPDVHLIAEDDAPFDPANLIWTTANASPPELNLYYHTEFIHGWYKVLDPDFSALDYPLPAVANVGSGYDNAYWNGEGTYYGSGGTYNNFAMYSDVIYHEYTHGVTDGIYPEGMLPYINQPGALNEAWSDYFACTINQDPLMAEWIGGNGNVGFRDLENTKVFPDNWVGEVHGDSEFISGALWIIRQTIGADAADDLAHFARYALAETFFDYLVAVLETDDDDGNLANGTPNDELIYSAFGIHGIGPGDLPHFALSGLELGNEDEDRFNEAGETLSLSFRLTNDVPLYPPPATNVEVMITTEDSDLIISNGNHTAITLSAGEFIDISDVLIEIAPTAQDHWGVVRISVTSNGGEAQYDSLVEFTIGVPRVVIVEDDPTSDVERFVKNTVRSQDKIFDRIALAAGEDISNYNLDQYGLMIWLSGNADENILSQSDRDEISNFINWGRKVILSGQNILTGIEASQFVQDVLGVTVNPNPSVIRMVTTTAAPFENGSRYLLAGSGGASNQVDMTAFTPTASVTLGYYGTSGAGQVAAVSFANGNGLLLGFGVEAISDTTNIGNSDRADFMQHIYDWAGELLGTDPQNPEVLPVEYSLGAAYPNPFNSSTSLPYILPQSGGYYDVFDILGRQVSSGELLGGKGRLHWSFDGPSGIYFVNLRWNGGQAAPVKVVLLR